MDDGQCIFHILFRTLIHGDGGLVEQSLFLQMDSESLYERTPVITILLRPRGALEILRLAAFSIYKIESHFPWNHRVAVYLAADAHAIHEISPLVENAEIITPAAVFVLCLLDH